MKYCMPPPPPPPAVTVEKTFLGVRETKESIEARTRWIAAAHEWNRVHRHMVKFIGEQ